MDNILRDEILPQGSSHSPSKLQPFPGLQTSVSLAPVIRYNTLIVFYWNMMHRLLWPTHSGESGIASLLFPKGNSVFAACPSRLWIRGQKLASPTCCMILPGVCDRSSPGSLNVGWGNTAGQTFIWTLEGKAKAGPERQLSICYISLKSCVQTLGPI